MSGYRSREKGKIEMSKREATKLFYWHMYALLEAKDDLLALAQGGLMFGAKRKAIIRYAANAIGFASI
jgi:hypothetical protein